MNPSVFIAVVKRNFFECGEFPLAIERPIEFFHYSVPEEDILNAMKIEKHLIALCRLFMAWWRWFKTEEGRKSGWRELRTNAGTPEAKERKMVCFWVE